MMSIDEQVALLMQGTDYGDAQLQQAMKISAEVTVKSIGFDVLRHRLTPTFEAEAEGLTAVEMIRRVFDTVHVP